MVSIELVLLHHDDELLAIDKPAGLRSTRERDDDHDNVEAVAAAQLGRRVWAVHQLDQDTSGVLLLVTRRALVAGWQKKLAAGSKRYLALVGGVMAEQQLTIDAPLLREGRAGRTLISDAGKPASTRVKVVARGEQGTAVLCLPQQGRTHQIRAHLAHAGHALLGDRRYASPPSTVIARHALHLWQVKAAGLSFTAPLPADLLGLAGALGLTLPDRPPR